jgi:hypothetical protein
MFVMNVVQKCLNSIVNRFAAPTVEKVFVEMHLGEFTRTAVCYLFSQIGELQILLEKYFL